MYKKSKWIIILIGLSLAFALNGCNGKPIKIGFVAELTGRYGELGVMARDGALLAVEEINAAGGVNGRPIELIIRDDQGDPEIANEVDAELIDEGVVAIIGHITSGQTAAVLDQINSKEVVLISTSSASTQFSNLDDYFLRLIVSSDKLGTALAEYIFIDKDIHKIAGVYDSSNEAYTKSFWESVSGNFEASGGVIEQTHVFDSRVDDLDQLVTDLGDHEAVVLVTSAVDAAIIIQKAQQEEISARFFSSGWAQTSDLIENGGQAVEGLELIVNFHPENPFPAFEPFVDRYVTRFGDHPGLLAPLAYDTVRILAEALESTNGEAEGLREKLLETENFEGVQGFISFNQFGDIQANVYIAQVVDGNFEIIKTIDK